MARKLKCRSCLELDDKENMIQDNKMYFHIGECYEKYKRHLEFKQKENEEYQSLCNTIKDIHKILVIPTGFIYQIQDLRNGNVNKKGQIEKKYKNGVPFNIIEEAYYMAKPDIEKVKSFKQFDSSLGELRYGLAIVVNKINEIALKRKKAEQAKVEAQKIKQHSELMKEIKRKVEPKQREDEIDLTTLLD